MKLGWNETALEVLVQAQQFAPTLVSSEIKELREKMAGDVGKRFEKAGKNKELLTWFHLGDRPGFNNAPWIFSDYGIMAPKTDKQRGAPILVTKKKLEGDARIKIEVKPGPSGKAEFIWNYRRVKKADTYKYDHCGIVLNPRASHMEVVLTERSSPQSAGEGTLIMNSFKNAWIPIEIEMRGKECIVKVPKNEPIKFKMFGKNEGHLCLGFNTENRGDPQAEFRHLEIEFLD